MPWIQAGLPGSLLGIKFLLKLFVGQSPTRVNLIEAIIALPVDVVFLAASLLAGFVLAVPQHARESLTLFAALIAMGILAVYLSRQSNALFTRDKLLASTALAILNFIASASCLVIAVGQLSLGAR